jgi:hypothetical protein
MILTTQYTIFLHSSMYSDPHNSRGSYALLHFYFAIIKENPIAIVDFLHI